MSSARSTGSDPDCAFCRIVRGDASTHIVFEDEVSVGFLDHRPVFHGHTLLIPRRHVAVLADLPTALVAPFFANVQLLARVIETGLGADGSFVAVNNRVSQSVPHLHVHVVPRRRGDGLRGFFWPRQRYASNQEMTRVQGLLVDAIAAIRSDG